MASISIPINNLVYLLQLLDNILFYAFGYWLGTEEIIYFVAVKASWLMKEYEVAAFSTVIYVDSILFILHFYLLKPIEGIIHDLMVGDWPR